ncbi:histidine kinase, partial [Streptomyces sp. 8K308]
GGGAGLGLAIVDSPVRAHGGRVEIHTTPGAGTNVRLLLPRHA